MGQGGVAILVPMTVEVRPVLAALPVRKVSGAPTASWEGSVGGRSLTVHQVGIGPARTRRIAAQVVEQHRPVRVVVCGIAGGLSPDAALGDLVVPAEVIDAASGERYRSSPWGSLEPSGSLVTTEGLWGAELLAGHRDAGVTAVDMESSAAAEVAARHDIPWTAIRGISDLVAEGIVDEDTLAMTRPDGTTDVAAALRYMVRRPGRVAGLMRVANDTRRATSIAAAAVAAAVEES